MPPGHGRNCGKPGVVWPCTLCFMVWLDCLIACFVSCWFVIWSFGPPIDWSIDWLIDLLFIFVFFIFLQESSHALACLFCFLSLPSSRLIFSHRDSQRVQCDQTRKLHPTNWSHMNWRNWDWPHTMGRQRASRRTKWWPSKWKNSLRKSQRKWRKSTMNWSNWKEWRTRKKLMLRTGLCALWRQTSNDSIAYRREMLRRASVKRGDAAGMLPVPRWAFFALLGSAVWVHCSD